ncbi:MAG: hypothetical protein LBR95_06365 [Azoarcus sp.]|nr:hypothetical protein [Azoarcus sp.]
MPATWQEATSNGTTTWALLLRRATTSMIEEIGAVQNVFEEMEMLTQHQETWFDEAIEKGFCRGGKKAGKKPWRSWLGNIQVS